MIRRSRSPSSYGGGVMTVRADRPAPIRVLLQIALVPAAALGVHQLRFLLAFGGGAGAALARQGHAYLTSLVPWIVALVGLAAGGFLWALGRALRGQTSARRFTVSLFALWVICTGCLVAIYATQEVLEGLFATGHPVGLSGVFGYGGWWAILAAACLGLVLAAAFHGARWILDEVARRHGRRAVARSILRVVVSGHPGPWRPRLSPLAWGWSGRGPPA